MLTQRTRRQFLQFCDGQIDAEAFEAWVCADEDLESQIGHGAQLDLITADYRGREAVAARERCAALLEQHHPGNLRRYRIGVILRNMVEDRTAVIPGLRKLICLRQDDEADTPIEFVGFHSELDDVPSPKQYHLWEPTFLSEILRRKEPHIASVQRLCAEVLERQRRQYSDDV